MLGLPKISKIQIRERTMTRFYSGNWPIKGPSGGKYYPPLLYLYHNIAMKRAQPDNMDGSDSETEFYPVDSPTREEYDPYYDNGNPLSWLPMPGSLCRNPCTIVLLGKRKSTRYCWGCSTGDTVPTSCNVVKLPTHETGKYRFYCDTCLYRFCDSIDITDDNRY